jgi:hypothetical protein
MLQPNHELMLSYTTVVTRNIDAERDSDFCELRRQTVAFLFAVLG